MNIQKSKTPQVLIFDFDGVILESVDVKDEAFRDLFPDTTDEQRQAILDFHRTSPGIHRRTKIRRILVEVLGRQADDDVVDAALERFRTAVWARLMRCDEVPGVRKFLEARLQVTKYVVSASPHEELRKLAGARDLTKYFSDVLGSPPSKVELLRRIIDQESVTPDEVIMYGDKNTDFQAATEAGIHFVGRETPQNTTTFPAGVRVIKSFI